MKNFLSWTAIGLLTTAILDPIMYSMFDQPIPWVRDIIMGAGGLGCFYLLIKHRYDL